MTVVGGNTALHLLKAVDKTTAKSGDTLTYTITYTNASSTPVSNIVVSDGTPSYTTFVSASCGSLPSGITACTVSTQPSVGGTGSVAGTNCTICVANPTDGTPMLPTGKYVVEVVVPPGYELVKEEDKNILIGDNYIAPVTQEFGALGSIFILPDQATIAE